MWHLTYKWCQAAWFWGCHITQVYSGLAEKLSFCAWMLRAWKSVWYILDFCYYLSSRWMNTFSHCLEIKGEPLLCSHTRGICICSSVQLLSSVWLLATSWTAAFQAPPSMGFSRQEYWSGLPLSSPIIIIRKAMKGKSKKQFQDGVRIGFFQDHNSNRRNFYCYRPPLCSTLL